MSNHFHLAVETPEPNLSVGMKWLQGTWIRRYNGLRRIIGRPFQGRFKALVVEPGHALGQVCHYIHLNPVRARIVDAGQAVSYPWSSLPKWDSKKRPTWLEASTVLTEAGSLPDSPAGWKRYLQYLEFLAMDVPSQKEFVAERMSRGWCFGSREFRTMLIMESAQRGADLDEEQYVGLEPEAVRENREELWEQRLQDLAGLAAIDLEKVPPKKSDESKVLLAAAMKHSTSDSNGWFATRLGMGEAASPNQFVRRWILDAEREAKVRRLLSRI